MPPPLQGLWEKSIKHLQHGKLEMRVKSPDGQCPGFGAIGAEEDDRGRPALQCAQELPASVPLPSRTSFHWMLPLPHGCSLTTCSLLLPCCLCHGHATPFLPFPSVSTCSSENGDWSDAADHQTAEGAAASVLVSWAVQMWTDSATQFHAVIAEGFMSKACQHHMVV